MVVIVLLVVLGFRSSANLASAYGIAATGTMVLTTASGAWQQLILIRNPALQAEEVRGQLRMGPSLIALGLMLLAGFLNLTYGAMAQTLVQVHAPPALRGRLIGLYNLAGNGLRAFSGVTIGVVGGLIGIHWSLALSCVLLLVCMLPLLRYVAAERKPGEPVRVG